MSNIVDRLYSQGIEETENTKLYSTGDDMLDELLTKAYCDGYEDAQMEYSKLGDLNAKLGDKYRDFKAGQIKFNRKIQDVTKPLLNSDWMGKKVVQAKKATDEALKKRANITVKAAQKVAPKHQGFKIGPLLIENQIAKGEKAKATKEWVDKMKKIFKGNK